MALVLERFANVLEVGKVQFVQRVSLRCVTSFNLPLIRKKGFVLHLTRGLGNLLIWKKNIIGHELNAPMLAFAIDKLCVI
jgi:hypothetical protein